MRYVGTAHVRQITREEWEAAGVSNQDTVAWYNGNGWTVAASIINDEAWPFIVADDYLVVEYDEDLPEIERMLPEPPNINTITTDPNLRAQLTGDGVEQEYAVPLGTNPPPGDSNAPAAS